MPKKLGTVFLESKEIGSYLGGILGQSTTVVNVTICFNSGEVERQLTVGETDIIVYLTADADPELIREGEFINIKK